jgi:hypothetical protein
MTLPLAFYSEPRFRSSSAEFVKLHEATTDLTLKTPGTWLALAFEYYQVEAFASVKDRDLACGPTAHSDVRYFPTSREMLIQTGCTLSDIACGHSLDHPAFEEIVSPIFRCALREVVKETSTALSERPYLTGVTAKRPIVIDRVRYTLSVAQKGAWLYFDVEALSLFENSDAHLMERTGGAPRSRPWRRRQAARYSAEVSRSPSMA